MNDLHSFLRSDQFAIGVLVVSNLLTFGLLFGMFWCAPPEDVTKSKKKMTWYVTTIEKESIDKETRLENLKIRDWNRLDWQEAAHPLHRGWATSFFHQPKKNPFGGFLSASARPSPAGGELPAFLPGLSKRA